MILYKVTLNKKERNELLDISRKGSHKSQRVLNALILLNCDRGRHQNKGSKNQQIADVLGVSMKKIDRVKKRFVEDGLDVALNGHTSTRTYEKIADGNFEANLLALSCSKPPDGFARWSLRLLADKAVELQYIPSVSHETVRQLLKKTKQNLGKNRAG